MSNRSGFQRDLLYVIAGSPRPNGLEVKSQLEEYYDEEINHGRLYPNLDELVDDGLVKKGAKDQRTNYYVLTDAGEQQLDKRREWEREHHRVTA